MKLSNLKTAWILPSLKNQMPSRVNSRRFTSRRHHNQTLANQNREKIMKAAKEQWFIKYKRSSTWLTADFSPEITEVRGEWQGTFSKNVLQKWCFLIWDFFISTSWGNPLLTNLPYKKYQRRFRSKGKDFRQWAKPVLRNKQHW